MAIIPDWTLIVQIVNFIVLIMVLNAVLYKPIRNMLIERQKTINQFEKDIDTLQEGAAENDQTFQSTISEAKAKGFREKEAMKEAGEEEEKRLINELQEKAQGDLEAVRAQIAKDAGTAREKLKAQSEAFSVAIAEKILGRSVS
jgi:F-type H+-transporting ATPase subunit b